MNATETALHQQWKEFQATLVYSTIRCFICDEPMYYSSRATIVTSMKKPVFSCKCLSRVCYNDKCGECDRPVTYNVIKKDGYRFRCTCGHSDLCAKDKIDETHKL